MQDTMQVVVKVCTLTFVLGSMLNVGLTQKPSRMLHHLRNHRYLVRMLLVNLVVVPAVMAYLVMLFHPQDVYAAGLVLLGMCAGAPFLIKLAGTASKDVALAATVMVVLMVGTIVEVPVMLPRLVEGLQVDGGAVARSLVVQMLAPIAAGMLVEQLASPVAGRITPWLPKVANVALYALLALTFVTNLSDLGSLDLWKAALLGLVGLTISFFVGYMMGDGEDHLKDVGGLSTAQRGTAAAIIVASQNFSDARVLVFINVLNAVNMVLLIAAAKAMNRHNEVRLLSGADPSGD